MGYKAPQFVDDPEKREARLAAAPKAQDRYGNRLVKIGHYWCSSSHERLQQIVETLSEDDFIIICRVCDGRYFSLKRTSLCRKKSWKKKLETKWYMFVDPEFQEVY